MRTEIKTLREELALIRAYMAAGRHTRQFNDMQQQEADNHRARSIFLSDAFDLDAGDKQAAVEVKLDRLDTLVIGLDSTSAGWFIAKNNVQMWIWSR